jgi:cell division septation protein DedD
VVEEQAFLPPSCSVGFNPMLNTSDGLLVHEYMDNGHLTYEQAQDLVNKEVEQMAQTLLEEGTVEIDNVGTLTQSSNGTIDFVPYEAGVLSPEFYGLEPVNFALLDEKKRVDNVVKDKYRDSLEAAARRRMKQRNREKNRINRRHRVTSKVFLGLALFLVLALISLPTANLTNKVQTATLIDNSGNNILSPKTPKKSQCKKPVHTNITVSQKNSIENTVSRPVDATISKANAETATKNSAKSQQRDLSADIPTDKFCIVLASNVSKKNAKAFVKQLMAKGYNDVSIYEHGKMRRVIYSSFTKRDDAVKELNKLHNIDDFKSAWVYELR